jgi:hypothetical protein
MSYQDYYRDPDRENFHDIERDDPETLNKDKTNTTDDDADEEPPFAWVGKMLQGNTTGRRIKSAIFKFGMYQVICGFSLLVITLHEQVEFSLVPDLITIQYGASLLVSNS